MTPCASYKTWILARLIIRTFTFRTFKEQNPRVVVSGGYSAKRSLVANKAQVVIVDVLSIVLGTETLNGFGLLVACIVNSPYVLF